MSDTPLKVVSLDVGGTLLEPFPSVGHVYAEVAAALGLGHCEPEVLNRRFRAAWSRSIAFDFSRPAWAGVVAETFRGLIPEAESPQLFSEVYDRFARPDAWSVYSEVKPVLAALQEMGLRLIVASNWDERLRPLLAALGLAEAFEWIAVSAELGCHKPDPRFFERVRQYLQVEPTAILHVGDRLEEDVVGARAAGWRACLLARGSTRLSRWEPFEITSLGELPDWILSRRRPVSSGSTTA